MTTKPTYTPTPWYENTKPDALQGLIHEEGGRGRNIAVTYDPQDAAHIVRCVNEREELLAALRMALRNIRGEVSAPSNGATMKTLREVLARAEREEG